MASTNPGHSISIDGAPEAIFACVYKTYKANLPQDIQADLAKFHDTKSMIKEIDDLAKDSLSRPSKIRKPLQMIANIAHALEPYFEVVGIYVQTNPEYAGLVWGTLRFIFMMATNYTTFAAKIENALFRIASALPNFESLLNRLRRSENDDVKEIIPRFAKALAYIYSDILEFCHRICMLLNPRGKGAKHRLKRLGSLAWKPFDAHFAEIIEKFALHTQLFQDLQGFLQTVSAATTLALYERWESQMTQVELSIKQMQGKFQALVPDQKFKVDAAIKSLQERVAASSWATTFEHARSHRAQDSGEWLLTHPTFAEFVNNTNSVQRNSNVLFLYGKPGYGKTTLATVVIDHLKDHISRRTNKPCSLAFFFFDRQSCFNSSHDAFRALLAQLIFSRRFDEIILDIAAIARLDHDTGQHSASNDEIFAILHLFLLQFDDCTLVCDGIDECSDREEFLTRLNRLACDHRKSNFVLFSRPVMRVRKDLRNRSQILELDPTQNIGDLTIFVHSRVEDLIENDELVIPKTSTVDQTVSTIVHRANGMFLWATLFLGYLRLPSLSIAQRREALEDASQFKGLYGLYDGILAVIEKEYPGNSRRNIRRALSWVAGAFRTLHVDELRVAVAQMEDKAFCEDDAIPNFSDAIGPMTGALIEVTKDQTVRLIHITVAEYLTSTSGNDHPSFQDEGVLDFKPAVTHRYLAATCLAYLSHTVPLGPYVNRYSANASFHTTLQEYNLLEYSTRYWVAHLREFIQQLGISTYTNFGKILEESGDQATSFLSDKQRFTSWIEVLWHLGCPSEAWELKQLDWATIPTLAFATSIRTAESLLKTAYEEQHLLLQTWKHVLEKYPEEIWQPSISAFSDSKLRKRSDQATVSTILGNPTTHQESVVLQTKCSLSGDAIGILLARARALTPTLGYMSKDAKSKPAIIVTYQIRALSSDDLLSETTVEVPEDDVVKIDGAKVQYSYTPERPLETHNDFMLETSISATLMEVMVGTQLLKLSVSVEAEGVRFESTKHSLQILGDNSGFKRGSRKLWKLFLSPGAEFLLLLRNGTKLIGNSGKIDVDIFQDVNCRRNPTKPVFKWVAWKCLEAEKPAENQLEGGYGQINSVIGSYLSPLSEDCSEPETLRTDGEVSAARYETHHPVSLDEIGRSDTQSAANLDAETDVAPKYNLGLVHQPRTSIPTPRELPESSVFETGRLSSLHDIFDVDFETAFEMPDKPEARSSEVNLHFHPSLPQVVYAFGTGTYLWNFTSLFHATAYASRQEHIKIYDAPLRNIRIADSGNLLYGFEGIGETERVAVLDLTAYQKVFGKPQVLATRSRVLDSESGISQHIGELTRAGVLREALSQAQPGDSAMLAMTDSGAPALSILRRGSDDGSLVQKSLDPDGNMSMRTLMHLPEGLAKTADITMLRPQKQKAGLQNDSGHVRILLGVPPQDSYSFSSARNSSPKLPLPAVFERDASSITVVNIGTQPWIETSSHPHLLAENAESDKAATREVGVQIARKD